MEIFFHTIALEPARWTPRRVSQSVTDLFPRIAEAGFRVLEVFEPHLREESERAAIREAMGASGLKPEILSSYLNLAALSDDEIPEAVAAVEDTLAFFGFSALRLFPGSRVDPSDSAAVEKFAHRLRALAGRLSTTEILLETHDGSIADDPQVIVDMVRNLGAPNVGLLYQPTFFDAGKALAQFAVQKDLIRHFHLQNRTPSGGFETLEEGVIPWEKILQDVPAGAQATLEFVPSGICPEEKFDPEAALRQAVSEKAWVEKILR